MLIEHEVVYDLITTMQKQKGAIRVPLSLQEYIFNYLKETYPKNKMNGVKAKNAALVFGLLANEFYLINQNREPPIKEFFMTKKRWDKINAGQVMIETALKLLKEMKLIDYYNVPTPRSPYKKTRMFRIGCITLSYIATIMEEKCKKEDCTE
jgi:hypothetical protein